MRKIRDVLRLRLGHRLSQRQVAQSLRLSVGAVNSYLSRARRSGLGWPLSDDLDDARLERLLFPPPSDVPLDQRPVPDWAAVRAWAGRLKPTLRQVHVAGEKMFVGSPPWCDRRSRIASCTGQT
jgi:hypothetical protein